MLVGVAVEQQAIQRGPQRQVILGPCGGRGGSGGAPVRGSGDGGASSWGSTGPRGPQGALGTQPPVWDTPGLMPQSRTAGGTAWRSSHRTSSSASLRHTQSCPSRAGPRAAGVTPIVGNTSVLLGLKAQGLLPGNTCTAVLPPPPASPAPGAPSCPSPHPARLSRAPQSSKPFPFWKLPLLFRNFKNKQWERQERRSLSPPASPRPLEGPPQPRRPVKQSPCPWCQTLMLSCFTSLTV